MKNAPPLGLDSFLDVQTPVCACGGKKDVLFVGRVIATVPGIVGESVAIEIAFDGDTVVPQFCFCSADLDAEEFLFCPSILEDLKDSLAATGFRAHERRGVVPGAHAHAGLVRWEEGVTFLQRAGLLSKGDAGDEPCRRGECGQQ